MPIFADDGGKNQHSSEKDDCFKNKTFKFLMVTCFRKTLEVSEMLTNLCRVSFAAAGVATALSLSTVAHAKNASSDNAAPPLVVTVRHFSIATTRAPLTR